MLRADVQIEHREKDVHYMEIQPLSSLFPVSAADGSGSQAQSTIADGVSSFENLLGNALQGVNSLQNDAQQQAAAVATGNASSFNDAAVASEKALLALQLTTQVQNKVVAAYNQIMQMQI
jgi:flagellar hook-basal body complex protein FliE